MPPLGPKNVENLPVDHDDAPVANSETDAVATLHGDDVVRLRRRVGSVFGDLAHDPLRRALRHPAKDLAGGGTIGDQLHESMLALG